MRIGVCLVLVAVCLSGCAAVLPAPTTGIETDVVDLMLTPDEADGWLVTPDYRDVDGDTPDCTGAPYDWPKLSTIDHASQFLDRRDESVSVVIKRLDGAAALKVEALRGALAPCAPQSGELEHGAMIDSVGDDSFAYQSSGSDDVGDFVFSNMLVACGNLILEVSSYSYSSEIDQRALEQLVSPAVNRILAAEECVG